VSLFEFKPAFKLDDAALDVMLKQPQGTVGRWMHRKGAEMEAAAKRDVGFRTGVLRASIYRTHSRTALGQKMIIGTRKDVDYAYDHHQGTPRHIILGNVGKMLTFRENGKVVRKHGVRHPGTKANKFLSKQLILLKTP